MNAVSAELRALAAHTALAALDSDVRRLLAPAGVDGRRQLLIRLPSQQVRETGAEIQACGGVATVIVPRRHEVIALIWDARDALSRASAPHAPWPISAGVSLGDLRDYALLNAEPLTYHFDQLDDARIAALVLHRVEAGLVTQQPIPRPRDGS